MRRGLGLAWVVAAGVTAAAGCNNGGGSNDIDFTDLTTRLGSAYCSYAQRCGTEDVLSQLLLHSTITDCATQVSTAFANTQFARYQLAIDRGTLVYHGDHAAQCLSSFDSLGCGTSALAGPPPGCAETFEGTVADGGECSIDEECSTTSFCSASGTTCGQCMHRPQIGESCASAACADDAYCNAGTCAALLQAGASCSAGGSCASGLTCTMGTCAAPMPAAAGQPCLTTGCQTGLVCAVSGMGTACRAPRTDGTCQRVLGGSDCPSGQTCNATGTADGMCVPYPTAGQACTSVCAAPARCVNMVCQPSTELFQPCTGNDACLSGICDSGTCQPPMLCTP